MKIGLDFDGVIADSNVLKAQWAKRLFDIDISSNEIGYPYAIESGLMNKEQYKAVQEKVYQDETVGLRTPPVPGAFDSIRSLMDAGHEVSVITSRDDNAGRIAKKWAGEHGLSLPFVWVGPGASKKESARGLDVYFDDYLHKLKELVGTVSDLFLLSWKYNEPYSEDGIARRVTSWLEFEDAINKRARQETTR